VILHSKFDSELIFEKHQVISQDITTLPEQKLYENFQKFSEMNPSVILHGKFDSELTFEKH